MSTTVHMITQMDKNTATHIPGFNQANNKTYYYIDLIKAAI